MDRSPKFESQLDAAAKATWRWYSVARFVSNVSTLPACLVTGAILGPLSYSAFASTFGRPSKEAGRIFALGVVSISVAGGVVLMSYLSRRIARIWGMYCDFCGNEFDRDAYLYFAFRGECLRCRGRREVEPSGPSELAAESKPRSGEPLNPYAPPRTIERPQPEHTPVRVVQLSGPGNYLWLAVIFTLLGWVGLLVVLGKLVVAGIGFPAANSVQPDAPAWLQKEFVAARRSLLLKYLAAVGTWGVLFGLGHAGFAILRPDADPLTRLFISHLFCGATFAFVFLVVLPYRSPRDRRAGAVVLRSSQNARCEAILFPYGNWQATPRALQFRTQSEAGIRLQVRHALSMEQLFEGIYPRVNPDGWSELELPLDQPIIAGCPSEQLDVRVESVDNKPWLVRYERTPPPV